MTGTANTFVAALSASFEAATRVPDGVAPPVALLWTDADGQWKPLLPALMKAVPALYVLGPYAPEERQGPVIWLKCIVERTLPDISPAPDIVPVLYLPNVARQDLRAGGECPAHLQPLMELQYRGAVWHQRNGRDWTVDAFLMSADALGLDVAGDDRTREAMFRALPLLAQEPITALRGRRLEADDFDHLAIGDPIRDLLAWMSDAEAFEGRCDAGRWATFRDICGREFSFDPDVGVQAAADALLQGGGKWDEVWRRFRDAPKLYPGIGSVLRQARPKDLLGLVDQSRRPGLNEEREDKLRTALEAVADRPHAEACDRVAALDAEHKERRGWVWAQIGDSPFALALEPLGRLARAAKRPLGGASVEALSADYAAEGWRCDRAAIDTLAVPRQGAEGNLVARIVRTLYEPWLDRSARRFQELLSSEGATPSALTKGVSADPGTCILFVDGLRFDLGMRLQERLEILGLKVRTAHRLAPVPTVTATAKPMASPAHGACSGGTDAEQFYPLISASGKPADAQRLRDAMADQGIDVLEAGNNRMAVGAAAGGWTEIGKIDTLGHSLGAALVRQVEPEIETIVDRVEELLSAGWDAVRIVTDHGWLLMPGGLPKVELPPAVVETKWARCALVKGESTPSVPTYPWHWNPLIRVASPPGIGAFFAKTEYAHGGVSLQECVTPDLTVERGEVAISAKISDVTWRGMRCRVAVESNVSGLSVDLRLNWKQAKTSIVAAPKELSEKGDASLAVPDDAHEGAAASVVVFDQTGRVIDTKPTTVGEEP